MEASNYNAEGEFAKEHEDELMQFTTTSEDREFYDNLVDQTKGPHTNDNTEVNITECKRFVPLGKAVVQADMHVTTENSSSFNNSDYGLENLDALGDDASSALEFDGFGELFRMRKKRPTAHWRSFIHPLTWRCKWTELQIQKLQWQAEQYDREIEDCNKSKDIQLQNNSTMGGECARSLPFTPINANNNVLQRNKRKRVEATTSVASYMSHHNLFSYYENRKSFADGALMDKESKNAATQKVNMDDEIDDDPLSSEVGDSDGSFENMLRKIDYLHSQVGKLKGRADAVISANGGEYS